MGKSKLPMPNVRCEKKTKCDAKTNSVKEGEGGAVTEKKGVRKLFSWASGGSRNKGAGDARSSAASPGPSSAGPKRTVVSQQLGSPPDLGSGSRMAFSSSMPDAIASNTREVAQHNIDEYYTLRTYSPASVAKEQHQHHLQGARRADWRFRANAEDLYSELYPLSAFPEASYDEKNLSGVKQTALHSFTGGMNRISPIHHHVHPPRPPPSWPLPPTKSAAHFGGYGQRPLDIDENTHWTVVDEHSYDPKVLRPDYGSNEKFLTSANGSAHIYDEIYTEVEGSDGMAVDAITGDCVATGRKLFEPVTLHRLPPSSFSRPPSAALTQYERAKYIHLAPRLSEGSLHARYEFDDARRYVDIEGSDSDGDDEVFATNEGTLLRHQQQHLLPLHHQQQMLQQYHCAWSSLGNLSTVSGGIDQQLQSQAERRQARPSCGVWMAKLRATRRIYAELENLCDEPVADSDARSTPRCSSATVPPESLLLSPLSALPRSLASTRPASRADDSGTLTQRHVTSFSSGCVDREQGHSPTVIGVKQSPSAGGIVKYVQTEISPSKKAVETQTSRTLLRRSAGGPVDIGDSSEEYERAVATSAGARLHTRLPRPSLTGTRSPQCAAAAAGRSPLSVSSKRGPNVARRERQQQQPPAPEGGQAGAAATRAGRKSSDGGSLSEDAYAGGSESSPESYEDTDSSYYYSTAFRGRSATVDSQRPATAMALAAHIKQATRASAMNRSQSSIVPFSSGDSLSSTTYETRRAGGSLSSNVYDQLIDSTRVKAEDNSSLRSRSKVPLPLSICDDSKLNAVESELYSLVISSSDFSDKCDEFEYMTTNLNSIRRVKDTSKLTVEALHKSDSNQQMTSSLESAGEERSVNGRDSCYEQNCESQLDRKSLMFLGGAGTSDFSSDMDYATSDLLVNKQPTIIPNETPPIVTSDGQTLGQLDQRLVFEKSPNTPASVEALASEKPVLKDADSSKLSSNEARRNSAAASSVVHSRIAQYNERAALLSNLSPRAISDKTIQHFTFPPSLLPATIKASAVGATAKMINVKDDSEKSSKPTESPCLRKQSSSTLPTRIQKLSGSKKLPQPKPDRRSSPASTERYTQLIASNIDVTVKSDKLVSSAQNSPLLQQYRQHHPQQQHHLTSNLHSTIAPGTAAVTAKQRKIPAAIDTSRAATIVTSSSVPSSPARRTTHPPPYCHGQPSWYSGVQHMTAITLSTLPPDCAKIKRQSKIPSTTKVDSCHRKDQL